MIFPLLRGLLGPARVPMTYFLLALNLLVFVATYDAYESSDSKLDDLLSDTSFISTQGAAFAIMIRNENRLHPKLFSDVLTELSKKALDGDSEDRKILGNLALRNNEFMSRALDYDFAGDRVAIEQWHAQFENLLHLQNEHPSYIWGLSRVHADWKQYVTYQFSHSGFLHLFWNMVFLLIFGSFVEAELGSSFVILTYLGSGVIGAMFFAHVAGITSSPLVGASAAVSGLIALVGLGWLRGAKLRFFYWILPLHGYFGLVVLPSWLVLLTLLLPDVSGTIGASPEISSVAYAAHVGGALFGMLIAGLLALGIMQIEVGTMWNRSPH